VPPLTRPGLVTEALESTLSVDAAADHNRRAFARARSLPFPMSASCLLTTAPLHSSMVGHSTPWCCRVLPALPTDQRLAEASRCVDAVAR